MTEEDLQSFLYNVFKGLVVLADGRREFQITIARSR